MRQCAALVPGKRAWQSRACRVGCAGWTRAAGGPEAQRWCVVTESAAMCAQRMHHQGNTIRRWASVLWNADRGKDSGPIHARQRAGEVVLEAHRARSTVQDLTQGSL